MRAFARLGGPDGSLTAPSPEPILRVMSVFAVVFTGQQPISEAAAQAVYAQFPDAYGLNATTFLVRSDRLSSQIAEQLRIKGEDRQFVGVVFRVNHSYSGFTSRDLWEWLDEDDSE